MKTSSILLLAVLALSALNIYSTVKFQVHSTTGIALAGDNRNSQSANSRASHKIDGIVLPVISRVSVLSIHVRDTLVHDSIFHFLTDKLGLSVEYYPVRWNERKYAGVYAGNMFLEPCGPYSNFKYATNDFRAIFFGLNCESDRSLSSLAEDLTARHIEIMKDDIIHITDTAVIKPNIYFGISSGHIQNKVSEDSLRSVMVKNNINGPGIERIKEIRIGYPDNYCLERWKELIMPSQISDEGLCKINNDQTIRFVKSNIREVNGIVFKVRSLKKAKDWLIVNKLLGDMSKDEIALDRPKTFGLIILFSEKEN
jgi:hypothetical protein